MKSTRRGFFQLATGLAALLVAPKLDPVRTPPVSLPPVRPDLPATLGTYCPGALGVAMENIPKGGTGIVKLSTGTYMIAPGQMVASDSDGKAIPITAGKIPAGTVVSFTHAI